jgi:glycyl-tRNA synthetase alpha subunit
VSGASCCRTDLFQRFALVARAEFEEVFSHAKSRSRPQDDGRFGSLPDRMRNYTQIVSFCI